MMLKNYDLTRSSLRKLRVQSTLTSCLVQRLQTLLNKYPRPLALDSGVKLFIPAMESIWNTLPSEVIKYQLIMGHKSTWGEKNPSLQLHG